MLVEEIKRQTLFKIYWVIAWTNIHFESPCTHSRSFLYEKYGKVL